MRLTTVVVLAVILRLLMATGHGVLTNQQHAGEELFGIVTDWSRFLGLGRSAPLASVKERRQQFERAWQLPYEKEVLRPLFIPMSHLVLHPSHNKLYWREFLWLREQSLSEKVVVATLDAQQRLKPEKMPYAHLLHLLPWYVPYLPKWLLAESFSVLAGLDVEWDHPLSVAWRLCRVLLATISPATLLLSLMDGLTCAMLGRLLPHPFDTESPRDRFPLPFDSATLLLLFFAANPLMIAIPVNESLLSVELLLVALQLMLSWAGATALLEWSSRRAAKQLAAGMAQLALGICVGLCLGVQYIAVSLGLGGALVLYLLVRGCCSQGNQSVLRSAEEYPARRYYLLLTLAIFVLIASAAVGLWGYVLCRSRSGPTRHEPCDWMEVLSACSSAGRLSGGYHTGDNYAPSLSFFWYVRSVLPFPEYQRAFHWLTLFTPVWVTLSVTAVTATRVMEVLYTRVPQSALVEGMLLHLLPQLSLLLSLDFHVNLTVPHVLCMLLLMQCRPHDTLEQTIEVTTSTLPSKRVTAPQALFLFFCLVLLTVGCSIAGALHSWLRLEFYMSSEVFVLESVFSGGLIGLLATWTWHRWCGRLQHHLTAQA